MATTIVYTAITRGYDRLKPALPAWAAEAQFVAFLESPPEHLQGWQMRPIYRRHKDPCRNAKVHKVLAHRFFPQVEYSLWVDGCVRLKASISLDTLVAEYLRKHDLALFRHPVRVCLYEEGLYCLSRGLDAPRIIHRQMQKYFDAGYPPSFGLVECTVLLRRHSDRVRRFNEAWYQEIKRHSRRDQLSFNYVAHQVGLKYACFPGTMNQNPFFQRESHAGPRTNAG